MDLHGTFGRHQTLHRGSYTPDNSMMRTIFHRYSIWLTHNTLFWNTIEDQDNRDSLGSNLRTPTAFRWHRLLHCIWHWVEPHREIYIPYYWHSKRRRWDSTCHSSRTSDDPNDIGPVCENHSGIQSNMTSYQTHPSCFDSIRRPRISRVVKRAAHGDRSQKLLRWVLLESNKPIISWNSGLTLYGRSFPYVSHKEW